MRIETEHREDGVRCRVTFSEEEKAIIKERSLSEHYTDIPKGYHAMLDTTEQRRFYALKLAAAAAVSFFGIFFAMASGGHPFGGLIFFSAGFYAVWCLYRWLSPKKTMVDRVTIGMMIEAKAFIIAVPNTVRGREVEDKLLATFEDLKAFLADNLVPATGRVQEF